MFLKKAHALIFSFFLIFSLPISTHVNAVEATQLNDEIILQMVSDLEEAMQNKKLTVFQEMFDEDARITVNFKKGEYKEGQQFSKKDFISGQQQTNPDFFKGKKRINTKIEYYNDNTQALLTYNMVPVDFEETATAEQSIEAAKIFTKDEVLFQIKNGKALVMQIILNIEMKAVDALSN